MNALRSSIHLCAALSVLWLCAPSALADDDAFGAGDLDVVKPEPGIDTATISGKPSWCDAAPKFSDSDVWQSGRLHRTFAASNGIQGVIEAAQHICQRPSDKTWQTEAGYIVQKWMNWTRQSQVEAEKSLRARVQTAKLDGERDALCKELELSPEIAGPAKAYGEAKLQFFGCQNEHQTIWQDRSPINATAVGYYLDGDPQPDELMRAYWLFAYVPEPFSKSLPAKAADENLPLLYYAVAQNEFARLDVTAIDKALSGPPYNDYARMVAHETLSALIAERTAYEKALEKMTKGDDDYTAILRTAPKNAYAQWNKLLTQWKPEIERSAAFEKLLSSPSRKALKGCSATLFKDGEKVVKSFKITVYKDLVDAISKDPVANLLLGRLAICYAADNVWGASGALRDLVTKGRDLRGPRSLAYYAVVDAIAAAQKDRPRLVLGYSGFYQNGGVLSGGFELPGKEFDFSGAAPSEWQKTLNKGEVSTTKPDAEGVHVAFKKVLQKFEDYACTDDTRHPLKIGADGRIEYYRNCKALGTFSTQDNTPRPVVIAPLLTAGIRPGVFVQYVDIQKSAKNGNPFGVAAFTKKKANDPKITSFFGFGL